MTGAIVLRWSFRIVGALLVLMNGLQLTVGVVRLRRALAVEPIPQRFDEPLRTAWFYMATLGVTLGIVLLFLAADAAAGNHAAWKAGLIIGIGLVATGIASFLATGRHPGLLAISVFGLALVIPLLVYRA